MAQKSASQPGAREVLRFAESPETSRLRNGNRIMNRRQRREREKARLRQQVAKTTAEPQKPQQLSRKRGSVRLLFQKAAKKPSSQLRAGIKPLGTSSTNVRNQEIRARSKMEAHATDKRPIASKFQTQAQGKIKRSRSRPTSPLLYSTRLLILGVGIGAIAGTLLAAWEPSSRQLAGASVTSTPQVELPNT